MNADAAIQRLTDADLPWVAALEARSFKHPWSELGFAEELRGAFVHAFGARAADGQPVGYVLGRLVYEEGHLLKVAVEPGLRRTGLGGRLVGTFEPARVMVEIAHATSASARANTIVPSQPVGTAAGKNDNGMSHLSASPASTASAHAIGGRTMTFAVSAV